MLNLETKELKINDKLKRKIEIIGRFTNTTPIINNGYVKNITGTNVALVYIDVLFNDYYTPFIKSKLDYNKIDYKKELKELDREKDKI